ncbi:MAG: hypothetical protein K2W95_18460 [Candidatus Obscuribacterales bacterium]|nr:hypothetical protein [Candidatus Obscuribacterales bacterium]
MSIRRRYFVTLVSMCCWFRVVAAPGVRAVDDLLDEDLGFNSGVGGSKFGEIATKTLNHRDVDANFVINNLPVMYGRPRFMCGKVHKLSRTGLSCQLPRRTISAKLCPFLSFPWRFYD